jgi:hypothetical protein
VIRIAAVLAAVTAIAPVSADSKPKKDVALAAKTRTHGSPLQPGSRPAPIVNLYNEWTKEWLAVDPKSPVPPRVASSFLRDHYTNKSMIMDPKLVGILLAAAAHFHADTVHVVSGFRHPKYNLILRKKGHQVARDSEHTHGNAVDFFIPNVTTAQLHAWAKDQKLGGVGLYVGSGFVHMDTGPIRYWSGE